MKKENIFLSVFILVLVGGGFFYWWQDQKEVRELNESLPTGIEVVKSLGREEYKVVNKIDGYEFKVPMEWGGINDIEYIPERTEKGYTGTSISMVGKEGVSRIVTVGRAKADNLPINLESWAKQFFETFSLVGDFNKDQLGEFEIIKAKEEVNLLGMHVYFFSKDAKVYTVTNPSEYFIRYIISNGQW